MMNPRVALRWSRRGRLARRAGAMITELAVAAVVLTGAMAALTPLLVQQARLVAIARHERLALEELSNQLDRLTQLTATDLADELPRLRPEPAVANTLGGPRLDGELIEDEAGQRIVLCIRWSEGAHRERQRTLTAWLVAADDQRRQPSQSDDAPPPEDSP